MSRDWRPTATELAEAAELVAAEGGDFVRATRRCREALADSDARADPAGVRRANRLRKAVGALFARRFGA